MIGLGSFLLPRRNISGAEVSYANRKALKIRSINARLGLAAHLPKHMRAACTPLGFRISPLRCLLANVVYKRRRV